jgi:hypothetical protein
MDAGAVLDSALAAASLYAEHAAHAREMLAAQRLVLGDAHPITLHTAMGLAWFSSFIFRCKFALEDAIRSQACQRSVIRVNKYQNACLEHVHLTVSTVNHVKTLKAADFQALGAYTEAESLFRVRLNSFFSASSCYPVHAVVWGRLKAADV